jgi:Domain of unknown function (DUF4352)
MPDNNVQGTSPAPMPPTAPKPAKKAEEPTDFAHIPMSEEFDKAKWTLPPWQPVAVALAIVAVIVGIFSFITRAKPQGGGGIQNVVAVPIIPGDNVLVAVTLTLSNTSKKALWIHDIKAQLKTDKGEWSDDSATAVDSERYFQAFPDLKQNAAVIMKPEDKIAPGGQQQGTVVFSFPVTKEQFDQRKSLSVSIKPYDQAKPVVLSSSRQ